MIVKKKILNCTAGSYHVDHEVLVMQDIVSVARSGVVKKKDVDMGVVVNTYDIDSMNCVHYYNLGQLWFGVPFEQGETINIIYKTQV